MRKVEVVREAPSEMHRDLAAKFQSDFRVCIERNMDLMKTAGIDNHYIVSCVFSIVLTNLVHIEVAVGAEKGQIAALLKEVYRHYDEIYK